MIERQHLFIRVILANYLDVGVCDPKSESLWPGFDDQPIAHVTAEGLLKRKRGSMPVFAQPSVPNHQNGERVLLGAGPHSLAGLMKRGADAKRSNMNRDRH